MSRQYSNELTPDVLACQDVSPFSPAQPAEMSDDARALIEEQKVFCRARPVSAISRIATDGSQPDNGDEIISTPQGHWWRVRREGVPVCQSFLAEEV